MTDAELEELPLFTRYRATDPDTSREAAESLQETLSEKRQAVLALFKEAGADGLTDHQVCRHWPHAPESTYRKRRSELAQMGLLIDTGRREKRDGPTNRIVWALAEFAPKSEETTNE